MALHWASISTLPFLKLAKMISVLLSPGKKIEKKRLHFVPFFGGKWDPTCSSRRRGEGAGEIDRSRSGRQVGALGEGRAARVRGVEARLAEGRAETTARARRESLQYSRRCIRPPRPWGAARRRGEAGGGARGGRARDDRHGAGGLKEEAAGTPEHASRIETRKT